VSDLLAPFERARYRRASLYDAPEWYDVDYAGYHAEAGFYSLIASQEVPAGEAFVEVGAGTGRISLGLAREGARVHAVEPSRAMREVLLERVGTLDGDAGRVTVEDARLESFVGPVDERVAVVAFPFNAVLHIWSFEELVRSFRHVAARLDREGVFALDLTAPSWQAMAVGDLDWGRLDERTHPVRGTHIVTIDRSTYRRHDRALVSTYRFLEEGHEDEGWEITLEQRMWTYPEILHALDLAGFELHLVFGDVDLSPFYESSPRLLVSALKR
jgi:predicted RNA methylase